MRKMKQMPSRMRTMMRLDRNRFKTGILKHKSSSLKSIIDELSESESVDTFSSSDADSLSSKESIKKKETTLKSKKSIKPRIVWAKRARTFAIGMDPTTEAEKILYAMSKNIAAQKKRF